MKRARRAALRLLGAGAALLVACGEGRAPRPAPDDSPAAAGARDDAGAAAAASAPEGGGGVALERLPAGTSEEELAGELGAVPAWQAVLDRGRLLGRRGERGAAIGRVGPVVDGSRWLIDESEEARGLGIRLAAPGEDSALPLEDGQRVLAAGAWTVDAERRWVWQVERLIELPARAAPAGPTPATAGAAGTDDGEARRPLPADLIRRAEEVPEGARELVVVAAPVKPGDGWEVAEAPGAPASALLRLPGEGSPYGGQDYLAADERWRLEPGKRYAVRVIEPRRTRKGALPLLRAAAPPVRLPDPPPAGARPRAKISPR